jgi:hypothetical protein
MNFVWQAATAALVAERQNKKEPEQGGVGQHRGPFRTL